MNYINDMPKALSELSKFVAYVRHQNKGADRISFRDINGYLGKQEDYKTTRAENARKPLDVTGWKEETIGSGSIAKQAIQAMKNGFKNLVNSHQKELFEQKLAFDNTMQLTSAERAVHDIFCGNAQKGFDEALEVFGARYDIISFLFFIKNDSAYLPCSSRNMEKGFARLGIEYPMEGKCSWENYCGFLSIMREIRAFLQQYLPDNGEEIRLVDAHSFVWIMHQKEFLDWIPEPETAAWIEGNTEKLLQKPMERSGSERVVHVPNRSAEVVAAAKKRSNGICELCSQPAPFHDKKRNPYLEAHHIVWLSKGGSDTTDNVAALCPNCHTKMHVVDDEKDVRLLQKKRATDASLLQYMTEIEKEKNRTNAAADEDGQKQ